MNFTKEEFDNAFDKFMGHIVKEMDVYWDQMKFTHTKPTFEITEGPKNIKVIRNDGSQRSVHLFVSKVNGDVLKAASWKAPAKGARGNILNPDNGYNSLTPFGAKYLN